MSMKIAVTYDNGQIFQHFGRTEQFKVYDVEDKQIVSSEILSPNGVGHGALASLLHNHAIDVLICGGIGGGAQAALAEHGVQLCAGATGSADEAVEAYLRGELQDQGSNCDHHHGEGHEGGCHGGGHEGGCHGGGHDDTAWGPNVGRTCHTHYRGTFNDGTQFDSSYDRGEPLKFVCGTGMMISGFDKAVSHMKVGDTVTIHLTPREAYGESDPEAIFNIETSQMPGAEGLSVGQQVALMMENGQQIPVTVTDKTDTTITFDANHEMAGKELNFTIELVDMN